jgi:hypothetical protein
VFGFDDDDPGVFARTVDWIEANRLERATFHILTPYQRGRSQQETRPGAGTPTDAPLCSPPGCDVHGRDALYIFFEKCSPNQKRAQ